MKVEMEIEPKENSDLLRKNKEYTRDDLSDAKTRNGSSPQPSSTNVVLDGGVRGILIVVGSFLSNGLLFGVINSYGVIYRALLKRLQEEGVPNSESRAALVGSLSLGTTFICSPLSGLLTASIGLRITAVLGGALASVSLLLSSFLVNYVDLLCLTYGVLYGLGCALAYTPSLAILGHYFKKYLGLVNGIVGIGSSIFTVGMPPLMQLLIVNYGLNEMFRVLAVLTCIIALCGALFKPTIVLSKPVENKSAKSVFKAIVNVNLWKIPMYKLWALSLPIALFGYFVPYIYIGKYIEVNFVGSNVNLPLQCIAITSGIGRLTFGFLADKPGIDKILLQQISFYVIGTLTIILPFVKSYIVIVAISLCMGFFDGAFIALIGPIAFDLCGGSQAAQGIGVVLGLAALPLSIGPALAGYLVGLYNSYVLLFVLAGASPIIGATCMFSIKFYRMRSAKSPGRELNGHAIRMSTRDGEKSPDPLLSNSKSASKQSLPKTI